MAPSDTVSYADSTVGDDALREYTPYLALAFSCRHPTRAPARVSLAKVDVVELNRGPARRLERAGRTLRVTVADQSMSSEHARIERTTEGWELVDCGSKNGTLVNGAKIDRAPLGDSDVILAGHTIFVYRAPVPIPRGVGPVDRIELGADVPNALQTLNVALHAQLSALPQLAQSDISILITGETGTGKELVAKAIHDLSGRTGKLVPVNCGALAESLLESELFGHTKGSFSGATEAKLGLVRNASSGTLFLDEVSEMSTTSQVSLLRVIQEREVRPVGASDPVAVDVRFVAATNRAAAELADQESFRDDLYARLAGAIVRLPRLRHRREDIGMLIGRLLTRIIADGTAEITIKRDAAQALFLYHWPRNIRQLEQVLRAAVSTRRDAAVRSDGLPDEVNAAFVERAGAAEAAPEQRERRQRLIDALGQHRGNVRAVARDLGKAPTQIYRWCKQLDLDINAFRDRE